MDITQRIDRLQAMLISQGRPRSLTLPTAPARAASSARAQRLDRMRLHHGVYLQTAEWNTLTAEDQHLALTLAVQRAAGGQHVFSHESAAALHGLPTYGSAPPRAHVTNGVSGGGVARARLIRHRSKMPAQDVVPIAGMLCTSPERTLLDLARSGRSDTALACMDAYLRDRFRVERLIDEQSLQDWRETMVDRLAGLHGRRGVRIAREVVSLADPRKDSVLESVSHARLQELGIQVEIQVPVPGPNGYDYHVDFEFIGLKLFGECDGKTKYTDHRLLGRMTPEQVVYREKRRQDWICGTTGHGMVRWGYPDTATTQAFERRLRAFGVPIPRDLGSGESHSVVSIPAGFSSS